MMIGTALSQRPGLSLTALAVPDWLDIQYAGYFCYLCLELTCLKHAGERVYAGMSKMDHQLECTVWTNS